MSAAGFAVPAVYAPRRAQGAERTRGRQRAQRGTIGVGARGRGEERRAALGAAVVRQVTTGTQSAARYSELAFGNLAAGTWSWGNRLLYGYDPAFDGEIQRAFNALVAGGVVFFDSGDSYGTGDLAARAEVLLGAFRNQLAPQEAAKVALGTKLASYPWRGWTYSSMVNAALGSAARLDPRAEAPSLDFCMMHWSPASYLPLQERVLLDAYGKMYNEGYIKNVGVSNMGPRGLARAQQRLAERHRVPLSSLQVQLSPLCLEPVETELLQLARELNISVLGYSPLALGYFGSGHRSEGRARTTGIRRALFNWLDGDPAVRALVQEMSEIAKMHDRWEVSDVALAWVRAQGATPLVGVRSAQHAEALLRTMNTPLRQSELDALDAAARKTKRRMVRNSFMTR